VEVSSVTMREASPGKALIRRRVAAEVINDRMRNVPASTTRTRSINLRNR